MGRLVDILRSSGLTTQQLTDAWRTTTAAADLVPVPPGQYICRVINGELFTSKNGTPGYKISLEVADGQHAGRRVWHDVWLTPAAMAMAKRDLSKLGIVAIEQLEGPIPPGILLDCRVVIRKNDNGTEYNSIARFEPAGVEPPDPFSPDASGLPEVVGPSAPPDAKPASGLAAFDHVQAAQPGAVPPPDDLEDDDPFPFGANVGLADDKPSNDKPTGKPGRKGKPLVADDGPYRGDRR
jgi:hypothetical protein